MYNDRLRILGIRHHGPGSALALKAFFNAYQADCVLIEGAADVHENLISVGTEETLELPAAILMYQPDDFFKASYLPFTQYSPEWVAMKYAWDNAVAMEFIDLPMAIQYGIDELEAALPFAKDKVPARRVDPFQLLAEASGYKDAERWWERFIESENNQSDNFDHVAQLMSELRMQTGENNRETLLREAYMRKQIRAALKQGYERIAVVCGAWHVPALQRVAEIKASTDNQVLKGLKKKKVKSCWIPWSYEKLSKSHGYNAGVVAPTWYEHLFEDRANAHLLWLTRAARLLREEGLPASPAMVTDAVQMAESIASLRGYAIPGLAELEAAALSTLCQGERARLKLVQQRLAIGDQTGKVYGGLDVPLHKDLIKWIKKSRLTKYWEKIGVFWLKSTAQNPKGGIDLRTEADQIKSKLLHRLNALDINWGKNESALGTEQGSFKEYWSLKWEPSFHLKIIEAALYGNTVEDAASRKLLLKARQAESLSEITSMLSGAMKAHLYDVVDEILKKMNELSLSTDYLPDMLDSIPPLVSVLRFGDVRKTDIEAVSSLIDQFIPRICLNIANAVKYIDEDVAKAYFKQMSLFHQSILQLDQEMYTELWMKALNSLVSDNQVNPLISGGSTRMLFDKEEIETAECALQISRVLSIGTDVNESAAWLEGFLYGSGQLLVYQNVLFNVLDQWVGQLEEDRFTEILPVLRRTFSRFSIVERQKIFSLAQQPVNISVESEKQVEGALSVRARILVDSVLDILRE